MLHRDPEPWRKIARGQKITIRGRYPDGEESPVLQECEILDAGTYAAISIPAKDLANQWNQDPSATFAKYNKKSLILSGDIANIESRDNAAVSIAFKIDGKTPVRCRFTEPDAKTISSFRVGQAVTIFGELSVTPQDHEVKLMECLIFDRKE